MHHKEFPPPPTLQNSVKCFWYNSRDLGVEASTFEVMPDGYAEIIFHFGSACSIVVDGVLQPVPSPFIMGLQNQPVVFSTTNRFEVIAIRCFPWTVFDLLGLPSGKDSVRLLEHPISQLQATLAVCLQAGKIDKAVAMVTQYLLDVQPHATGNITLSKAGDAMLEANGTMPVSLVAAAAHATIRTLERKFKQSSGYSVKDVSGLIRFEQARNRLWHQPDTKLAGLAMEMGYADQAHLSKEFKRYSGTTPAAFARKAMKERPVLNTTFIIP